MTLALRTSFLRSVQPELFDDLEHLNTFLPTDIRFEDDVWDLQSWGKTDKTRHRFRLDMSRILHDEVRTFFKHFLLYRRKINRVSGRYGHTHFLAAIRWGELLNARSLLTTCGDDFYQVWEENKRFSEALNQFGQSLHNWFGLVLPNLPKFKGKMSYGTKGNDKGRFDKLVTEQVLSDLLQIRHKPDLPTEDRVMVNALAIDLACGFRVGELLLLPQDCLLEDEGCLYVRNFTSKGGREAPRLIPTDLKDMVKYAVAEIHKASEPGRAIARADTAGGWDWDAILKDEEAALYFVEKWIADWVSGPEHQIIRKDAAWSQARREWVDALGLVEKHGTQDKAARSLEISFNTFHDLVKQQNAAQNGERYVRSNHKNLTQWKRDTRILSPTNFVRDLGYTHSKIKGLHPSVIQRLEQGAAEQIAGKTITHPEQRIDLEQRFRKSKPIRLKDDRGNPKLFVEDMLFVFPLYGLSDAHTTKENMWKVLEPIDIIHWLGKRNDRPSVFERHNIIDERTGKIARFKSHDIRHWLNTTYQKGGLSQGQISTLFNRHDTRGNSPYNHTSNLERRDRLKESVRAGFVGGELAETYKRMSDISIEEAEAHLDAYTRQVNIMPHGLCTKDLATEPCPHHLSCFSCDPSPKPEEAKPCPFLMVDFLNPETEPEIKRIQNHASGMIDTLEDLGVEEGPQITHFHKIVNSTQNLLMQKDKPQ